MFSHRPLDPALGLAVILDRGHQTVRFVRKQLGQAKIQNFQRILRGKPEIGGLQVAMNDVLGVGSHEPPRQLQGNCYNFVLWQSPALEAMDVLAVLKNEPDAPADLRERACLLAGTILELGGAAASGAGLALAERTLTSGAAWEKFERIRAAQGGARVPPIAALSQDIAATRSGRVTHIDNRRIARLAKLAGAPDTPSAGLRLSVRLGDDISAGQPLLRLYADSHGEMAYALAYAAANPDMIAIAG